MLGGDIIQLISLIVGIATLVLLVLVFNALNALRNAAAERRAGDDAASGAPYGGGYGAPAGAGYAATSTTGAFESPGSAGGYGSLPQGGGGYATPGDAGGYGSTPAGGGGYGTGTDAGTYGGGTAGTPGYGAGATGTTGAEPATGSTYAPATTQPAAAATSTPAAEPEPQDQPFERGGRWYFRRGDELLVYDEQTGQWVAAERGATDAATPSPAQHLSSLSETGGAAEPAGAATAGMWKCPSCGAVNGSTATACRMCFTPRP